MPTEIRPRVHEVRVTASARLCPLPGEADDRALAASAQRGDREAFGTLYDRHAPLLLSVAFRMLGAHREAQDLVHDVFLEAWEDVRRYDPARGSFRTWLLVRLRSRALDRLGRAEAVRTRSLEEATGEPPPARAIPQVSVDGIAIRQALSQLDGNVREVLDCTFFGGLTAREIAALTGAPIGTVKSRLARGLAAVTALLYPDGTSRG